MSAGTVWLALAILLALCVLIACACWLVGSFLIWPVDTWPSEAPNDHDGQRLDTDGGYIRAEDGEHSQPIFRTEEHQ